MTEINYLTNLNLNYEDLETTLKSFKLVFYSHKDSYVENFNFEPHYFVYSFYNYILDLKKIPKQREFADFYVRTNLNFLKKFFLVHPKLNKGYLIKHLVYRLYRAYPSFVRDLHFSIFLKDKLKSKDIYYNPYIDVTKGIDVLINNKYGIHLYTNTRRANYYRKKKNNRHAADDYTHIDIPINFKDCYRCGDFFLYRDIELNSLIKELNKFEKIQI